MPLPAIPLAVRLGCLFACLADRHGFVTRRVIACARKLLLKELDQVGDWAQHLVTSGRVTDGVNSLRKWLKERIAPEVPRWVRLFVNPEKAIDSVLDFLIENEDEILTEARGAAALATGTPHAP